MFIIALKVNESLKAGLFYWQTFIVVEMVIFNPSITNEVIHLAPVHNIIETIMRGKRAISVSIMTNVKQPHFLTKKHPIVSKWCNFFGHALEIGVGCWWWCPPIYCYCCKHLKYIKKCYYVFLINCRAQLYNSNKTELILYTLDKFYIFIK